MLYNYNKFLKTFKIIIPILFTIGLLSCDKFDGNQTVPAYVHIDQIKLVNTSNANVGSLSNSITDAWVYVDDQYIGAFEMPATFPVLYEGTHTIKVLPGILMNGIANTRIAYPFYSAITLTETFNDNVTLKLDTLTTQYDPKTYFEFIENFEGAGITFQKSTIHTSDTTIVKTNQPGQVFEGNYSGLIYLDSAMAFFEIETINTYTLPRESSPVFLELNYKINSPLTIGIDAYYSGTPTQVPIISLNPTNVWTKIYVNLTPYISNNTTADYFKVYMGQYKDPSLTTATLLFDNIKLVHFINAKKK